MRIVNVTPNTVKIVKSTIPVLEAHGLKIINRMYEIIFTSHPALMSVFNMTNQGPSITPFGNSEQVHALSNALYQYANHIEDPFALIDLIEGVVAKHTSLQVQPEHYEVVEGALFEAMAEVLGGAFTKEIEDEWRTAYWSLSNLLIAMEKSVYAEKSSNPLGWAGTVPVQITQKTVESLDTVQITLARQDGIALPEALPGQYISLHSKTLNLTRQYSLISVSGGVYRLGIKVASSSSEKGKMSNFLFSTAEIGEKFSITMPAGGYNLNEISKGDVCLLSAGSGITPNLSLIDYLGKTEFSGDVMHFYSTPNSAYNAFSAYRSKLFKGKANFFDVRVFTNPSGDDTFAFDYEIEGRLEKSILEKVVRHPLDTNYFISGSLDFIQDMILAVLEIGVSRNRIQYEFFGSDPVMSLNADRISSPPQATEKTESRCPFSALTRHVNASLVQS